MLSMIAAIGKNRELGRGNGLPWDIPEDTKYFRDTTRGHVVIMGQKTFEVLGRPLPNRTNIVLTQDKNFSYEGVLVAYSPEESLSQAYGTQNMERGTPNRISPAIHDPRSAVYNEVFIIGGAMIYSLFMEKADRLYLTFIEGEFPDADVFFPQYDHIFSRVVSERESRDENYRYSFAVLERG